MNRKRFLAFTVAVLVTCTSLTGCGTKNGKEGAAINNEPLELTIFWMNGTTVVDTTLPVFQKAAELTNIRLKRLLSNSTTDERQAFSVMMATKEIADIVNHQGNGNTAREDFFNYGNQGAFVSLNDLIDKYAPNIKGFLEKRPDVRKFITAPDGNIYFIPYVPDGTTAMGWFIRKDWLDKLGLPVPKNAQEFHDVLVAFRDRDPNGNGKKDEIPYFSRGLGPGWESGISDLYTMWGVKSKAWYVKDGKVHFGGMEPEYKEAVKNVAKWYSEKLIDPEIYTRGKNARDICLGNNIGGVTHDWIGSNAAFNDRLKDRIPDFEFVAFPPPSGKENTKRELLAQGWCISSSNKYPAESMKYFDFWFTEQGRRLANFGIEGQQYDMVEGKPKFKDSVLKNDKAANLTLQDVGAQMSFGYYQDYSYEEQWLNPIALKGIKEYVDNGYLDETFPPVIRLEAEEKIYQQYITAITTHVEEMAQRWILGNETVDSSFNEYINYLKKMHIDELIQIQQAAYDRYMKQ